MGTVYKAMQIRLNREVALKVLEPGNSPDSEEAMKRFEHEAMAMKKLDHQNIVQVFDAGRVGRHSYIAMTYVPGQTLADLLRKRKQLELDEAIHIIKMVARGLLFAHSKEIVHRDIKPSNIIITPDNSAKITDFGISHNEGMERLTLTGTAMGTPEYMSPEQCKGEEVTHQSDIYSLGIVFYEMLTGNPPFTGVKAIDIAYNQVHSQAKPIRDIRPEAPVSLESLLQRCLAKTRRDRITSMTEFLAELDRVMLELHPPTANTPNKPVTRKLASILDKKPQQNWLLLLAFALIVLVIVIQVLLLIRSESKPSVGLLTNFQILAAWEQRSLENDHEDGYPVENLTDNDLQTAWLLSAKDAEKNSVIVIHFTTPTLITSLGVGNGYQRIVDDEFQDRFASFQKPKILLVKTQEGTAQKLLLQNVKGVQYPSFQPVETQELHIELREAIPGNLPGTDWAISELHLIGMEMPIIK